MKLRNYLKKITEDLLETVDHAQEVSRQHVLNDFDENGKLRSTKLQIFQEGETPSPNISLKNHFGLGIKGGKLKIKSDTTVDKENDIRLHFRKCLRKRVTSMELEIEYSITPPAEGVSLIIAAINDEFSQLLKRHDILATDLLPSEGNNGQRKSNK